MVRGIKHDGHGLPQRVHFNFVHRKQKTNF